MWTQINSDQATTWPEGVRKSAGKMISSGLVCVPETRTMEVLKDLHQNLNHAGIAKTTKEASRRFVFSPKFKVEEEVRKIRKTCVTCQACDPPTFSETPLEFTPIPPHIFSSVCLDLVKIGDTDWENKHFDSILVCVDRHSGWILANPCCQTSGVTAAEAAHMMLDNGWEIFGVPSIITSDQGPQFIGQWWKTMCARLGIRVAYSQAYRPQANGRAERACRTLVESLRKIAAETKINWVEALPRVLRVYHNTPGESGLSPFQIVFGRDRYEAGTPYEIARECEDAKQFFDRLENIDKTVSQTLNFVHKNRQEAENKNRKNVPPYSKGDWVWVLRPRSSPQTTKLDTWWVGPAEVLDRVGDQSYVVQISPTRTFEVHTSHMKNYEHDPVSGHLVDLFHFLPTHEEVEVTPQEWTVDRIVKHKRDKDGRLKFLTRWEGSTEETWEPLENFISRCNSDWLQYCLDKKLKIDLVTFLLTGELSD